MSDERDGAGSAGTDSGAATGAATDDGDNRSHSALVTRPQRPTGKRSRRVVDTQTDDVEDKPDTESGSSKDGSKAVKKTARKPEDRPSSNPITYVVNFLKEVVGELRKVIWPNRKQMVNYTTVVLVFLAFMVAMIGFADLGLGKLVMLVFG